MIQKRFRNSVGMDFVWIEPGTFLMGADDGDPDAESNEFPRHIASVERGFYLARTPVTLQQYRRLAEYPLRKYGARGDKDAANFISCVDADRWVAELNARKPAVESVWRYRLPTETEWEYACRAGAATRFSYGNDPRYDQLGQHAWFAANTWDVGERRPQPVGRKLPNRFGLCDMHANVWEWTSDGWALYADLIGEGQSARNRSFRVLRGGGWCHEARYQRASDRDYYEPAYRHYYTGFRICCDLGAPDGVAGCP